MERMLRMIWSAGFLEGEVEAAFAAAAGGIDEVGGHARLAGAGGAGDQDAAAAVIALAAQHGVQPRDAGGDPLGWRPHGRGPGR